MIELYRYAERDPLSSDNDSANTVPSSDDNIVLGKVWVNTAVTPHRQFVCRQPTGTAVWEQLPPPSHAHAVSDVTGLQAALDALSEDIDDNTAAIDANAAAIAAINDELDGPATATHVYLSGANGNDANDGLTPGAAVATYARVWELLPLIVYRPFIVHVGEHGGAGYVYELPPENRVFAEGAFIALYGDGAGQAGEDGFTEITNGVLGAGTTATVLQIATTPADDAYKGFTVEITSGLAAGYRRHIRSSVGDLVSPTQIYENFAGLVTPSAGDSYRILRPAVKLILPDSGRLVGSASTFAYTSLTNSNAPLHLVNVSMTSAFGAFTYILQPVNSVQLYFGVEVTGGNSHDTVGTVYAGVAAGNRGVVLILEQLMSALGLELSLQWQGWGLTFPEALGNNDPALVSWFNGGDGGLFQGYVVGGTVSAGMGSTIILQGGRSSRVTATNKGYVIFRVGSARGSSTTPPVPFLIKSTSGAVMQSLFDSTIVLQFTLQTETLPTVEIESTAVGSATSFLVTTYFGGKIIGYPNIKLTALSFVGAAYFVTSNGLLSLYSGALASINAPLATAILVEGDGKAYFQGFASTVIAATGIHCRGGAVSFRESRAAPITASGLAARIEDGGSLVYKGSATTWTGANAAGGAVEVSRNGVISQWDSAGALTITNTALGANAHGLKVSGGGRAHLRGGVNTPINANGYGVDARFGGQVYFTAQPSSVVGATADLIVDTAVGGQPDTALAASESAIAFQTGGLAAFNGSIIARAA